MLIRSDHGHRWRRPLPAPLLICAISAMCVRVSSKRWNRTGRCLYVLRMPYTFSQSIAQRQSKWCTFLRNHREIWKEDQKCSRWDQSDAQIKDMTIDDNEDDCFELRAIIWWLARQTVLYLGKCSIQNCWWHSLSSGNAQYFDWLALAFSDKFYGMRSRIRTDTDKGSQAIHWSEV